MGRRKRKKLSKRRRPKVACVNGRLKTRYSDEAEAKVAISMIASFDDGKEKPKRAYFCKECNGWHLTKRDEIPYEEFRR